MAKGDLFAGSDYDPKRDDPRLLTQLRRIWNVMLDGLHRTVPEICAITGDPANSVQAQLRNMRKEEHGSHDTPKRRRGGIKSNDWEYVLYPNQAGIHLVR